MCGGASDASGHAGGADTSDPIQARNETDGNNLKAMNTPDPAWAHLRSHHEGTLIADGLAYLKVRFVVDNDSGCLIMTVPSRVLNAREVVLFVPEELPPDEPELQVLVNLEEYPEGPGADRWQAYHGQAHYPRWAKLTIESARFAGALVEPETLRCPNPLGRHESSLCRRLNADRARLRRVCQAVTGVDVREPVAVGVDPLGVDVRARFGVVRLTFPTPAWDAPAAEQQILDLLARGAQP